MHWFYYVGRVIAALLVLLFFRCKVIGKENVPREGKLLVVANHLSLADPPLLAHVLPRKTVFLAKEELFQNWFTRYFIGNFGAFPVQRGRFDDKLMEHTTHWMGRDVAVVMFPEGGRSSTGALQYGFTGSAVIATRFGAPILPVGITGTENMKGRWWWLRRSLLTVNIGKPFTISQESSRLTKDERARLTGVIMKKIAELLPPDYRGVYAEKPQAD